MHFFFLHAQHSTSLRRSGREAAARAESAHALLRVLEGQGRPGAGSGCGARAVGASERVRTGGLASAAVLQPLEVEPGVNAQAHVPVLLEAFLTAVNPKPGQRWIDGTFGRGGHTLALLEAGAEVLALDRDPEAVAAAHALGAAWPKMLSAQQLNFDQMADAARARGWEQVDGVLLDLGVSSPQLETDVRGFSLQREGPLDMRMDPRGGVTAAEIVNGWDAEKLAEIFAKYGDEPRARAIAKAIVRRREKKPFATTTELAEFLAGTAKGRGRVHPATRIFQALRMAVNDELGALERALPQAAALVKPGGVVACISFHSGEDRRVKRFFQKYAGREMEDDSDGKGVSARVRALQPAEERPQYFERIARFLPDAAETEHNPRARSARLRVAWRSALPWLALTEERA